MNQYAQFQYSGINLTAPGDVFPARVPITGKIRRIAVWSKDGEANASGDSIFNFNLNGGDLFSGEDRLKILAGEDKGELIELDIDVTEGDWILVQIESVPAGGVKTPLTVLLVIDDEINNGLPTGGLIGWILKKQSSNDFDAAWELEVTASYNTDQVTEGVTNFYFTDGRAQAALASALAGKQNDLGFTPENAANKNVAGGYVGLDGATKIASTFLPSYVDDVLEYANFAALPAVGETGKLYITINNGWEYRWSGSVYARIVASPGSTDEVTEGAANLYFSNARVLASPMSGLAAGAVTALANGQSLKTMLENLQAQISNVVVNFGRTTQSFSTNALASLAGQDINVAVGKTSEVFIVETDYPARVRAYATSALRAADQARAIGTEGTEIIQLEVITSAGNLKAIGNDAAFLFNGDTPAANTIYFRVENQDVVGRTITVTITKIVLEA